MRDGSGRDEGKAELTTARGDLPEALVRQPARRTDREKCDVGDGPCGFADRIDEEQRPAEGEADEAHDLLSDEVQLPADDVGTSRRDALPVHAVRQVSCARAKAAHPVHQHPRRAQHEIAVPQIRVFDRRIHDEVEVVEHTWQRNVERRKPDGLVADAVREEVESFLGDDRADVSLEEPFVREEAAFVVARDAADRVGQARRAMDDERTIAFDLRREAVQQRARGADRLPRDDMDLVATTKQPFDQVPLALSGHPCPGQVRDPEDLHARRDRARPWAKRMDT